MKINKSIFALAIPVIIILVAVVFLLIKHNEPTEDILVGMFETTTVNVSSEIPGRIDSILVELGQYVEKGQVLAMLEANIMEAKLGQAEGIKNAAHSLVKRAEKGARKEEIKATKNQYQMAKSQFDFAEKTYNRFQMLYADTIISRQEMDEMEFKYNAARDEMGAAKAIWEMAKKGATPEEIAIVKGELEAANGLYNEAAAFYEQLALVAPVSGEISNQIAEEGEVMAAGYPILTIMIPEKIYAIINVREDKLADFQKGKHVYGNVPGLGNKTIELEVTHLAAMADFATWVPTKAKGEYDLKTFEVRLKPVEQNEGLRPGMTIQVKL